MVWSDGGGKFGGASSSSDGRDSLMRSGGGGMADSHSDPMEAMGNLFDIAILIGVGFMIMAVSGMGLSELYSKEDMTVVKNPGTTEMEIITKKDGEIRSLKSTKDQAQGQGTAIGTVYQLEDGGVVWIPEGGTAPTGASPAGGGTPEQPSGTPQGTGTTLGEPVPSP